MPGAKRAPYALCAVHDRITEPVRFALWAPSFIDGHSTHGRQDGPCVAALSSFIHLSSVISHTRALCLNQCTGFLHMWQWIILCDEGYIESKRPPYFYFRSGEMAEKFC